MLIRSKNPVHLSRGRSLNVGPRPGSPDAVAIQRRAVHSPGAASAPNTAIRYAYYAFIFLLPFEEAIGGLSLFGLLLGGLAAIQPKLFLKSPPRAFWCFATYSAVVGGLGLLVVLAGGYDIEYIPTLITEIFRLIQLLVLFMISYRLMMFESIAERSLLVFAVACLILAVLQLSAAIPTEVHGRGSAFGYNPNVMALLQSLGVLCIVGLAYGRMNTTITMRLLPWVTSAFLLIVIVRTGSRGSVLALGLALLTLIVRRATMPQKLGAVVVVMTVIVSVAWGTYQIASVRDRWENTYYEGEVSGRDILFPIAWEMFLERPIIGWGPVTHYWEMNSRTGDPDGGDPHNLYLWVLKETGLLGFSFFFAGLWICLRSAWKGRNGLLGSLPLACLIFILASNMKGTYLYYKVFWLVLAYALASGTYLVARSEGRLPTIHPRRQLRRSQFVKALS